MSCCLQCWGGSCMVVQQMWPAVDLRRSCAELPAPIPAQICKNKSAVSCPSEQPARLLPDLEEQDRPDWRAPPAPPCQVPAAEGAGRGAAA